ncbi:Arp8p KNAG_0B04020 [Huiozyma naganishii CBS 8797]|uniref:Uncharacterized protein n=1 Tax=Huiozyma naganishii (strain ATCC MYA-139 / BCRC 22969 / CBS 8797 / KCTC 17520 / NBRC 10181 / NCYC 3082 / Yp74L-3) TaxID=1071383 RepID=J7S4W2_HUIN7|nr:hypothetical protein KNAG_0B04020 [Kazachstania naganishii CBS 8797]CCK68841.1 hypothetical protein KNAG_0B04020 [Kazachstania naganishii CBS 8797]
MESELGTTAEVPVLEEDANSAASSSQDPGRDDGLHDSAQEDVSVMDDDTSGEDDEEEDDDDDDDERDDHVSKKMKVGLSKVGSPSGSSNNDDNNNDEDKKNNKNNNDGAVAAMETAVGDVPSATASPTPSVVMNGAADEKQEKDSKSAAGKKVPLHLLEKRRLGRIKAAEEFAKKLKQIGIEKVDSTTLPSTGGLKPLIVINQKNYSSDYIRKDDQIFALRERKFLRSAGTSNTTTTTTNNGSNTNGVGSASHTPEVATSTIPNEFTLKSDDIDFTDATTTIVIQPGSESIKIGFATDETPLVIPNCVAVPHSGETPIGNAANLTRDQPDQFLQFKEELQTSFKERMRHYKRRVQLSSYDQVNTFNETTKPEIIEDQNDPAKIAWRGQPDPQEGKTIYVGDEALLCLREHYMHRRPFGCSEGKYLFNLDEKRYTSLAALLCDVSRLLEHAIDKLLKKRDKDTEKDIKYKAVLVIPDLFEKSHVETMIRLLLSELPFNAVAIVQESLATCYGSGISTSTCVVNVGATGTKVACVDEGIVVENSIINLNYGGDDISKLFAVLLLMSNFPYQEWDIDSIPGRMIAEHLKKECLTFQDADITTQLFNFIKRVPGLPTEKIEFKTFDEVILAPLALFYPKIFSLLKPNKGKNLTNPKLKYQLPDSRDLFTNKANNWKSLSEMDCATNTLYSDMVQESVLLDNLLGINSRREGPPKDSGVGSETTELNLTALDKSVIQSITNATLSLEPGKMASFYSNILIVGGSSNIPGFDTILKDRINMWRPKLIALASFPNFYNELVKEIKDLETSAKTSSAAIVTGGTATATPAPVLNDDDAPKEVPEVKETSSDAKEYELNEKIQKLIEERLEKYLSAIERQNGNEHFMPVSVTPAPHNMNPSLLPWRGAGVLAQIKLIEELFVTNIDWDVHGSRVLQHKCIFTY